MCAASMSVPPTATATAQSRTLPPLRSTFELLIDAAGELDSRPPPHVSVQHPSMQYARTAVAQPLPPHISLSSSTGMAAAAHQSFFDASPAPLRNMPQLPSLRMAPGGGHLPRLPPLVSDYVNQQSSQDGQPRTTSPSSSGAIPLPPPLPHHAPRNIAPKPHTRLACRILPRASAACTQPAVSIPVPVAPAPAPVHSAATAAVAMSRPRGGIVKPGTNSASGSPASSSASLAAAVATVMGSVDAVQNAQSEVEKRQLVRKMRNREAAARSNQKRKIRHDKLKSELSDVKNRVATLRDKERLLMEENGRLKQLTA